MIRPIHHLFAKLRARRQRAEASKAARALASVRPADLAARKAATTARLKREREAGWA